MSTLYDSVICDDVAKVRKLIKNGADVNQIGIYGHTSLTEASYIGNVKIVRLLLKNGADVNAADVFGRNALFAACAENSFSTWTGIGFCVKNYGDFIENRTTIVELLLKNGAQVNKRDKYDMTVLMMAAFYGYVKIIELLLKNGADVDLKIRDIILSHPYHDHTALSLAIEFKRYEVADIILEHVMKQNK